MSAVAKEEVRVWLGDIILELPNYSQLPTVTMKDLSLFRDGQSADEPELEGSFSRVINMLLQRLNGQCDKFLMVSVTIGLGIQKSELGRWVTVVRDKILIGGMDHSHGTDESNQ